MAPKRKVVGTKSTPAKRKKRNWVDLLSPYQPTPPEGMSYQWNVSEDERPFEAKHMAEQGWTSVPPDRHPDMLSKDGLIIFRTHAGMTPLILMERAINLTREAQVEDYNLATSEVRQTSLRRSDGSLVTEVSSPPPFKHGDEIWDRQSGVKLGRVFKMVAGSGMEIMTTDGHSISIGSGDRASPFHRYPKIEDMVKSEDEAKAYLKERAMMIARRMTETEDEALALVISMSDGWLL